MRAAPTALRLEISDQARISRGPTGADSSRTRSARIAEAAREIQNADHRPAARRPRPFPPRPNTNRRSPGGGGLLPADSRAWDLAQIGARRWCDRDQTSNRIAAGRLFSAG